MGKTMAIILLGSLLGASLVFNAISFCIVKGGNADYERLRVKCNDMLADNQHMRQRWAPIEPMDIPPPSLPDAGSAQTE